MNQKAQWTVEIVVDAPLKRVWEVAEDITLIPQYHPEVNRVDLIAGQSKRSLGVKYQCNILEGRRAGSCVEEVVAYEPERMVPTRMVSDTWGLTGMLTDFTVEATVSRRTKTSTVLKFQTFSLIAIQCPLIGEHLAVSRKLSSQLIANKRLAATSESAKWSLDFWRTRSGPRLANASGWCQGLKF